MPPHGLLFPISSKGSFICTISDRIAHTTPVVEQWLEREIYIWSRANECPLMERWERFGKWLTFPLLHWQQLCFIPRISQR